MKKTKIVGTTKTQIIGIVEDNQITGVKYGLIENTENILELERAKSAYDSAVAKVEQNRTKKIRGERTKHK